MSDDVERMLRSIAGSSSEHRVSVEAVAVRARQLQKRRRTAPVLVALALVGFGAAAASATVDWSNRESIAATGSESSEQPTPGVEALIAAIRTGDQPAVSALLEAGADLNGTGQFDFTPIMIAAIRNDADTIEMLVDYGAALEATSRSGHTALHLAARNGNADALEALIAAGAALETPTTNRYGSTALMIAVSHNQREMVDMLVASGADVSAVDDTDRGVAFYALDNLTVSSDDGPARALVETLITEGASILLPDGSVVDLSDLTVDEAMRILTENNPPRQS